MHDRDQFDCWALVTASADVQGVWVGHCLNFDVVAQGNNPHEAIENVKEAAAILVTDDIRRGADPNQRKAPEIYWERLTKIFTLGRKIAKGSRAEKLMKASLQNVNMEYVVTFSLVRADEQHCDGDDPRPVGGGDEPNCWEVPAA